MNPDFLTHSYLALREKLFRSAVNFLKDEEGAKDAMQDAYINLLSRSPVSSDSEAASKLFMTLKNRCIDILRKQSRHRKALKNTGEPIENPIYENIDEYEKQLISNLSDRQIEVYRYIVHEGLEYDKIAQITGKSVESIRTEMSRIRKKIQSNIKNKNL